MSVKININGETYQLKPDTDIQDLADQLAGLSELPDEDGAFTPETTQRVVRLPLNAANAEALVVVNHGAMCVIEKRTGTQARVIR
ncbi:hypothetical protein [Micrococcus luteus]|uniref:hypothetical protein n=1 Tax=Micrococcus luteus TaxID=1270 RepID=UPI00119FC088|nr:hypothetical protein [Micrococcus luteus]